MSTAQPSRLKTLTARLMAHKPAPAPAPKGLLVYGYVCLDRDGQQHVTAYSELLELWASVQGWSFGGSFRDIAVRSAAGNRPGFRGLLDVMQLPSSSRVLVVERRHLSDDESTAASLARAIRRTASTLEVLTEDLPGGES